MGYVVPTVDTKPKPKTITTSPIRHTIRLRLNDADMAVVQTIALANDLNMTDSIREALRSYHGRRA